MESAQPDTPQLSLKELNERLSELEKEMCVNKINRLTDCECSLNRIERIESYVLKQLAMRVEDREEQLEFEEEDIPKKPPVKKEEEKKGKGKGKK